MSAHTDAWVPVCAASWERYQVSPTPFRLGYALGCAPRSPPRMHVTGDEPGGADVDEFERVHGRNERPFGLPDIRPEWNDFLNGWRAARAAEAAVGE